MHPEARKGRTAAEEQMWMQLHTMYVREIEVRCTASSKRQHPHLSAGFIF